MSLSSFLETRNEGNHLKKRQRGKRQRPGGMTDITQYKVGVVLSVTEKKGCGKPLKSCIVNVGEDKPINVVTSATNVRDGSRWVLGLIFVH